MESKTYHKKWKTRKSCAVYNCHNYTKDDNKDIIMIPFAKPCSRYIETKINPAVKHDITTCVVCSKCKRWMTFCNRADANFQQLLDITNRTYICNQHFIGPCGPTDSNPDPVLQGREYYLLDGVRHGTQKRSAETHLEECCAINNQDSAQLRDNSVNWNAKYGDQSSSEATMKTGIKEHPIGVKSENDFEPTFERHYVYIKEERDLDTPPHSEDGLLNIKQNRNVFESIVTSEDIEQEINYTSHLEETFSGFCQDHNVTSEPDCVVKQETNDGDIVVNDNEKTTLDPSELLNDSEPCFSQHKRKRIQVLCADCNRTFCSEILLKQHKIYFPNCGANCATMCTFCHRKFGRVCDLKKHFVIMHAKKKRLICQSENCVEVFNSLPDLVRHISLSHVNKKHQCLNCNILFPRKHQLTLHCNSNPACHPFNCQIANCDKIFLSCAELKTHVKEYHFKVDNVCDNECEGCGMLFPSVLLLNQHKMCCPNFNPYECPHCHRKLTTVFDLKIHMVNVHNEDQTFVC